MSANFVHYFSPKDCIGLGRIVCAMAHTVEGPYRMGWPWGQAAMPVSPPKLFSMIKQLPQIYIYRSLLISNILCLAELFNCPSSSIHTLGAYHITSFSNSLFGLFRGIDAAMRGFGQITSNFLSCRLYEIRQLLICLCTTSKFLTNTTRPLRLFKQVICRNIWQLPLERNTTERGEDRQSRQHGREKHDWHLDLTFQLIRTLVKGSFCNSCDFFVCCHRPLGLSIYYVIRNGGAGSSRFITILHRGSLLNLLQYYRGGVFKIYYNITVLKGKWKVIILFQL